jgi:hypothetical protein
MKEVKNSVGRRMVAGRQLRRHCKSVILQARRIRKRTERQMPTAATPTTNRVELTRKPLLVSCARRAEGQAHMKQQTGMKLRTAKMVR